MFSSFKRLFFNENVLIRHQILILFSSLIVLSIGGTLALCLGFLFTLGDHSEQIATNRILSLTYHNAKTNGKEIAASIEKILVTLSESSSLVTASYASLLLQNNFNYQTSSRFPNQTTYREYHFTDGCAEPLCPKDYGSLFKRSRIINMNGSMEATSFYLYSSSLRQGIQSDDTWNTIMNEPFLRYTKDTISYLDNPLKTTYKLATDVMFLYLSIQVSNSDSGQYYVLHRVFPGTSRNDNTYDPSKRSWFTHAPLNSITVQGPYIETFTKKHVLNLSSRQKLDSNNIINQNGRVVTVVGATVLLWDTISRIISDIKYPNNGFGVLLKYDTLQVIVWGNDTNNYDTLSNQFRTVSDFDPTLTEENLKIPHAFQHTDTNGTKWVISTTPFLKVSDYQSDTYDYSLILLVYSRWQDAFESLPILKDNIDETEKNLTFTISVIAVGMAVILLLFINLFVFWLTMPLESIVRISTELIKMSSEDEKKKNYLQFVDEGIRLASTRTDEIGLLSSNFWQMIWKLHIENLKKKNTPKYPPNPFYSETLDSHPFYGTYLLTSKDLSKDLFLSLVDVLNHFGSKKAPPLITDAVIASAPSINEVGIELSSGDVLSRIGYQITMGEDLESHPTTTKVEAQNSSKLSYSKVAHSDIDDNKYPGRILTHTCFTIGYYLSSLGFLLFLSLCALVAITITILASQSYLWMDETSQSLTRQQIINMFTITESKSHFSKAYFDQISLNTQVLSQQFSSLLDKYHQLDSFPNGYELQSYSNDPNNYFASSQSKSTLYSGYFHPNAANCKYQSTCSSYQYNQETRLTSLIDVQSMSLFYPQSTVSFLQLGFESSGFSRTYPYAWTSYGEPTQCFVTSLELPICQSSYETSRCSSTGTLPFPPYDARCRPWYTLGSVGTSSNSTYFQPPRKASNNQFVITAVTPLRPQEDTISIDIYGVLNLNVLATDLSNSVNNFKILDSGYVYIIDRRNHSQIILHPRASSSCSTLQCAEGSFTSVEYSEYLSLLSNLSSSNSAQDVVYMKGRRKWLLVNSQFQTDTIDYMVLATVPFSEILAPSKEVENEIDKTIEIIVAVGVVIMLVFLLLLVYCIYLVIFAIQKPIFHIITLCQNVIQDNLKSSQLQENIESRDMKILFEAFRGILIALRFGNEAYISGNMVKAREVYGDALVLFETLSNEKGISACHNNLGGIYLALKQYDQADIHFLKSIEMATKRLETLSEKEKNSNEISEELKNDLKFSQQILSDRKANYSLLQIELKKYPEAFEILENCLEMDMKIGYINGCVNKQGNLGHLYLRQGEITSAEKQFLNSLLFLDNQTNQMRLLSSQWNHEEIEISKQIALFNYGKLFEEKGDEAVAIHFYVLSLMTSPKMNQITTIKTISALHQLYSQDIKLLQRLDDICHEFSLFSAYHNAISPKKRVAIALDYSGSMSGTKIRSAIENILSLFHDHIQSSDEIFLLHFNSSLMTDLPFTIKEGNNQKIEQIISSLTQPYDSTYLYDAINTCINSILQSPTANDWLIILTDGEDTGSKISSDIISKKFHEDSYGVILIGIGSDVNHNKLRELAISSPKGFYIETSSDREGITKAFGQVKQLMQENVIFEDI